MHELSITEEIVALALEKAKGKKILSLELEVGELTAVLPHAISFCFEACTKGTAAEGAKLHIDEITSVGKCKNCNREISPLAVADICECGCADFVILKGRELNLVRMEVV